MNYERSGEGAQQTACNNRFKKAGAVRGEGLAVDVLVAVMFESRGTMA
ncbi:MAG: hypothetical protein ABL860_00195 [Candidatus Nitrotoga sp.]